MSVFTVRSASPSDLAVLLKFEQGIVNAERPFDDTLKPDPISYYDVAALIRSADAEVAVAEKDERLIGSGYARKKPARDYVAAEFLAFIGFLYVVPDMRGQGVNQAVLDHLFEWARRQGLPEIHLTVYPENASALRAYQKSGFDPYILEMRLNLDEKS